MRISVIAVLAVSILTGCAESRFMLSPESRLPKWFEIPEGEQRQNYTVTLSYYVWPSGREAVFTLKKNDKWWLGERVKGKSRGLRPLVDIRAMR